MDPEILFAYGTLMEPQVQQAVLGAVQEGIPDVLPGYRKIERAVLDTYPGLEHTPDEKSGVDGLRFEISKEALQGADAYEGSLYYRKVLKLNSGVTAWVYLPTEKPTA